MVVPRDGGGPGDQMVYCCSCAERAAAAETALAGSSREASQPAVGQDKVTRTRFLSPVTSNGNQSRKCAGVSACGCLVLLAPP